MKQHVLGIIALLLGIVALGLAVVPGIVLDQPLPFGWTRRQPTPPPPPRDADASKSGVTFKYKKFSVTFGGDKEAKEGNTEAAAALPVAEKETATVAAPLTPEDRDRLLKGFTIAAVCCSLVGLIFGPLAWAREKQPALSGSAMTICCAAIVWQYIVIGIAVGLVVAIVLLVQSHLG